MVQKSVYKISSMRQETPDTVSFVLSGAAIEFLCGQFVMVHYPLELAGKHGASEKDLAEGKPVKRAYSIASSSVRGLKGEIELCVKAMPDGWISKLLQEVKLGQELEVSGPFGRFTFDPLKDKDIVMLAAGSGIAPMHAMIEQICLGDYKDVKGHLIFSNKVESDIIYRKVFDKFACDNSNVKINNTLTRCADGSSWDGSEGRINSKMLSELCGDSLVSESKLFFICGPSVFVKSMRECLEELGVGKDRIRFESYG